MSRQIKFRGKSSITGEWVTGDSIKHTDNATENGIEELIYIGNKVPNARKMGAMKWVPVTPSSIGQFTGCVDRNKKEIYEDDVVLLKDNSVAVVRFVPYLWGFYADFHTLDQWDMEIIGNIHDDPKYNRG